MTIEPVNEWVESPFGARIHDGKMYGRGTSDMKGGLSAALMAMKFLRKAGVNLAGDVIFESVVNEEHSGNGTLDLIRRGYTANGAIVLEPTHNKIAVSHPGGLYWQITIPGCPRSPGALAAVTREERPSSLGARARSRGHLALSQPWRRA